MFRTPISPSSGAREYYTGGCYLWHLVLWFSSCRYGVERFSGTEKVNIDEDGDEVLAVW